MNNPLNKPSIREAGRSREARIDKVRYQDVISKIQEILKTISGDIRGKASVALFGTVIISPNNYLVHLQPVKGGHLEIPGPRDPMAAMYEKRQFCELPPFSFPDELRDEPFSSDGGFGTPAACPPPQLVDGKFIIESSSDCVTYPFYGMAFNLRGQTAIAFNPGQYPPDMELLEGILWVKDFRNETPSNLAKINVKGLDHRASIKPTAETGVDFTDDKQVRVFSTLGKTIVEVDYLALPTEMQEKDDIIFLLADPDGPGEEKDAGDSGTEMCIQDASQVNSPAVDEQARAENVPLTATGGCSHSPDAKSFGPEGTLKGTLTLGFLFILGRRKNGRTKKQK